MRVPLENAEITSEYGIIRKDGKLHKGIDLISSTRDRNIRAIKRGVVSYAGYDKTGFGNYVVILHPDGYKSFYCHLEKYNVSKTDKIEEGQIIGIEGTSGNSTGVHLHLELRKYPYGINNHINVAEYLGIKNKKGKVELLVKEEDDMAVIKRLIDEYGEEAVEKALKKMIESVNDDGLPAGWAKEELEEAKKLGITDGERPEMYATRQETAIMIKRAIKPTHENP